LWRKGAWSVAGGPLFVEEKTMPAIPRSNPLNPGFSAYLRRLGMTTWFHNWRRKRARKPQPPQTTRPELEGLEQREVPTVTYHGGALLAKVEIQALYYGSDRPGKPTLHAHP